MSDPIAALVSTPTPVEAAPRLAVALGLGPADLLLKREDLGGVGGGGNKLRKLQVTLAQALEAGARTLVTTGAAQSNHARLTAAAGARLGLDVVLVLAGSPPPGPARGNLLLDDLLGARVVWAEDTDPEALADEIGAADPGAHRIPFGGSSSAAATAYAAAGREILDQAPDVRHVVVALGSGGTMAGLVAGLGAARVLGVHTGAVVDPRASVASLLSGMDLAETPGRPVDAASLRIDLDRVGAGYEHLGDEVLEAMRLVARTEGVVLDPVYTGRAAAGLRGAVADGTVRPGEQVVLVHTGGLPGLFGHAGLGG